ncbi:hypothetical protein GGX14DRAFT_534803 [Mycena pura]|uniref:Aminoglycoside phosphotransferase domain-containing protein n=1 Tax=Mycena pura TaxID=153505 RepID=A0AAD6VDK9_9AGAR|nr:hypothetical protein GGX14DRAFT_534803 [Mycena pura]
MPPLFRYQRSSSFGSLVWALWLHLPPTWRGAAYRLLIRLRGEEIPFSYAHRLPWFYAKLCWSVDEALATEHIRTHTAIPVPYILDVVPSGCANRPWLMISSALSGRPLFANGTGHRLIHASEPQLQRIKDDLRGWIAQLRALRSPYGGRVCGFAGGPLRSFRAGEEPVGPFDSIVEFHSQDFCVVAPPVRPRFAELTATRNKRAYTICLVHGDLLLHNLLADEDFRLTGMIDLESAAWMPEYWETLSSSRSHYWRMWCWKDILHDVFPQYEEELELDREIQTSRGD